MKPVVMVPRAMAARKPRHGAPCNRCGVCCVATICELGRHVFERPEVPGPCPALLRGGDGTFHCGLLSSQAIPEVMHRAAALIVGVDLGCDCRINGEPRNDAFAEKCAAYDERPDVKVAKSVWGIP